MTAMKKKKYLIWRKLGICCLLCLFVLGIAGCKSEPKKPQKEQTAKKKAGTVDLYYLNSSEDGFETVPYELENAGECLLAAYEIAYKLSETESSNTSSYKPSIYDGVTINSITEDDGVLTVDMGAGYRQLDSTKEILMRASMVKSLVQIKGVKSVMFTINGDSLLGSDENPVGAMNKNTFLLQDDVDVLYEEQKTVTLYYANEKGDGLVEYETELRTKEGMKMETEALQSLVNVPDDLKAQRPIPKDLVINSTQIHNKVCYVDLSKEIENVLPGVDERVMVYSMVNTITSLGNAASVQFTVEGKKVKTIRKFDKFHLLMTNDYSLCGEQKEVEINGESAVSSD